MRKSTRVIALVALACAASAAPTRAQDMTGTWVLSVELDAGSGDATFELVQDGGSITGTYSGALGEADVTGTIEGGRVTLEFESQAGKITYSGTVDGDSYEGTCEYGQLGSGTFSGSRKEG